MDAGTRHDILEPELESSFLFFIIAGARGSAFVLISEPQSTGCHEEGQVVLAYPLVGFVTEEKF